MRAPLGADTAYKRLVELVGKRVEIVTIEGRWFGWLRIAPQAMHEMPASATGQNATSGEFTLWGARDDVPDHDLPSRAFRLVDVLAVREMP